MHFSENFQKFLKNFAKFREILEIFANYFEFELTNDQLTSLEQVLNDLSKKVPMRRMLQGEVGSGKTLVALISLFAVINSGLQGAMMAPTEILAFQHFKNFKDKFENAVDAVSDVKDNIGDVMDNVDDIKDNGKSNGGGSIYLCPMVADM